MILIFLAALVIQSVLSFFVSQVIRYYHYKDHNRQFDRLLSSYTMKTLCESVRNTSIFLVIAALITVLSSFIVLSRAISTVNPSLLEYAISIPWVFSLMALIRYLLLLSYILFKRYK